MMRVLKGFKVFVFNGIILFFLLGIELLSYLINVNWNTLLGPEKGKWVLIGVTTANIMFRFFTNTPIFRHYFHPEELEPEFETPKVQGKVIVPKVT